jgi:tRNA A37 threonylcarbamoyladenosine modification protein TsaB
MNFLVIDGTKDKIIFFSKFNNSSYRKSIKANKNNNEKLSMKLFEFFNENAIKLDELNNIFVNQGPGKFSGIRTSIAVAKALCITNKLNIYGFNSKDLKDKNYKNIISLCKKGVLIKNLINPVYLS